jgi:hypothetical protein
MQFIFKLQLTDINLVLANKSEAPMDLYRKVREKREGDYLKFGERYKTVSSLKAEQIHGIVDEAILKTGVTRPNCESIDPYGHKMPPENLNLKYIQVTPNFFITDYFGGLKIKLKSGTEEEKLKIIKPQYENGKRVWVNESGIIESKIATGTKATEYNLLAPLCPWQLCKGDELAAHYFGESWHNLNEELTENLIIIAGLELIKNNETVSCWTLWGNEFDVFEFQ